MSKVLYPKPEHHKERATPERVDQSRRPFHVEYTDPEEYGLDPEWRYYNNELSVKLDSWFRCRVLGFRPNATLYERNEVKTDG